MMYTLKIRNNKGQVLDLTSGTGYSVSEVVGLDPPEANLNMTRYAGADGSVFNSAYVDTRQITITLKIEKSAEENRLNLYKYAAPKMPVRLLFSNGSRSVYIDGIVQGISIGIWDKKQVAQIVITCPQPWLIAAEETVQDMAGIEALFEFPFSIAAEGVPFSEIITYIEKNIQNKGDIPNGAVIELYAAGAVDTPRIVNIDTGEFIELATVLQPGDQVTINTIRGQKGITLLRDGVRSSLIGALAAGSTWLQLTPGDNILAITAGSGAENMSVSFFSTTLYEGV